MKPPTPPSRKRGRPRKYPLGQKHCPECQTLYIRNSKRRPVTDNDCGHTKCCDCLKYYKLCRQCSYNPRCCSCGARSSFNSSSINNNSQDHINQTNGGFRPVQDQTILRQRQNENVVSRVDHEGDGDHSMSQDDNHDTSDSGINTVVVDVDTRMNNVNAAPKKSPKSTKAYHGHPDESQNNGEGEPLCEQNQGSSNPKEGTVTRAAMVRLRKRDRKRRRISESESSEDRSETPSVPQPQSQLPLPPLPSIFSVATFKQIEAGLSVLRDEGRLQRLDKLMEEERQDNEEEARKEAESESRAASSLNGVGERTSNGTSGQIPSNNSA